MARTRTHIRAPLVNPMIVPLDLSIQRFMPHPFGGEKQHRPDKKCHAKKKDRHYNDEQPVGWMGARRYTQQQQTAKREEQE